MKNWNVRISNFIDKKDCQYQVLTERYNEFFYSLTMTFQKCITKV